MKSEKKVEVWEVHATLVGRPITIEVKSVSEQGAKDIVQHGLKISGAHLKIEFDTEKWLEGE